MLAAALFTLLSVGLYAHVDGWVIRKEIPVSVLGRDTSSDVTTSEESRGASDFFQTMWCRLRYGSKCEQMRAQEENGISEDSIPVEQYLEREIRNLENEIKTDRGEDQGGSYWSM